MKNYDISKLENVHPFSGGIRAACCECKRNGADKDGNHLTIWNTGQFSCIIHPGDKTHNRAIYQYLYTGEEIDIDEKEEFFYNNVKLKYFPEVLLDKLLPDYSYWNNRGISNDILIRQNGGLASKQEGGKLKGRYVFPIRNKDHKIVGWAGRLLEHSEFVPKWKILGSKKNFLFPARNISEKEIKDKREVILVESIGCSLALEMAGFSNTKVLFGVKPSSQLISYLISLDVKRIIISTNNESSGIGNRAAEEIQNTLIHFFNKKNVVVHLPAKKDFNDMLLDGGVGSIKKWYDTIPENKSLEIVDEFS